MITSTWVKRAIGPVVLAAAMLVAGSAAGAAASGGRNSAGGVDPAITPYVHWGWVNVTTTTLGVYTPAAINRGNSAGSLNVVNHYSTGSYTVTFRGIGDEGGVPHVSVIGSPTRWCGIGLFGKSGTREFVDVECYDATGTHAEAKFTVSFLSTNYGPNRLGYLWHHDPSNDYDVFDAHSHNNAGGPNHVTRTAAGTYTVTFPNLGTATGDVQVTPYFGGVFASSGPAPAGIQVVDCTVASWSASSGDLDVKVRCFNTNGLPEDTYFTVTFMEDQGLKGPDSGRVAYLWASRAGSPSYTPPANRRFSHPGGSIQVTREGFGKYTVTLGAMGSGGTVKVTAYASTPVRCIIKSIRTTGSPQKIKIRCYSYGFDPANTRFTLAYQR